MDIILVRHGEAEANVARIFGGPDAKLSEVGIEQAIKSREYVSGLNFDRVYSSPFKRAVDTMHYLGLEGEIEEDIREIGFGVLENKSYEHLNHEHPEEAKKWAEDPFYYAVPDGETLMEAYERVKKVLERLIEKDENVLLVCHEGVIKLALSFVFDNPKYFFKFKAENVSINTITIKDGHKFISKMNKVIY